jgi:predicted RNA binding protein YcfA (HicA-like mRNA interferase family)
MGSIPVLKPKEVASILNKLPFHGARDISPILLRQIAKDIGLTVEELIRSR